MANSTLLQLVNRAENEMGLPAAATIIANTAVDVVQQLALLNAVGNELQREFQWQAQTIEYRFTTVFKTYTGTVTSGSTSVTAMSSIVGLTSDSTFSAVGAGIPQDTYVTTAAGATVTLSQAADSTPTPPVSITFTQTKYTVPTDFDRLVDRTDWDKSKHWEMLGPETGQQWQWLKSGYISTGPRVRFRMLGTYFQIWPPIGVADVLGFEYVAKNWVTITAGTLPSKASFTVDTDTCIYPDQLMVNGLKYWYLDAKGLGTMKAREDWQRQKSIAFANDGGSAILSMAPRLSSVLISATNIPDSGYGT